MQCSARKNYKQDRGFALLVTIVLVAFLVLILVGLATFTRVETQVSDNAQQLAKARQNALSGLNIALGQLQRYAGPDRVVTARADITAAVPPLQPYLTGTWDNTGALTSWLVSGNENAPLAINPSTAVLDPTVGTEPVDPAETYVFLLGRKSVNTNAERVRLPKQPIVAPAGSVPGFSVPKTIGNYAFWVGDDGVKASAQLVDEIVDDATSSPLVAPNPINYDNDQSGGPGSDTVGDDWSADFVKKERLNQLSLPRQRIEKILTTVNPDLVANVTALPTVLERNQLRFLTGTPTSAQVRQSFHDLTPISRGVLADTNTGRLRTDVSSSTGTAGAVTSYQTLRPTATAGLVAEYFPVVPNSVAGTWPTYGVAPVLSEAGIRFYFSVAGGQLTTNVILDAEIWNPYAATLKTDATSHLLKLKVTIPADLRFKITDSASATQNITLTGPTVYTADVDTTLVWGPGAVVRISGGSAGILGTGAVTPGTNSVATALVDATTVDSLDTVPNLEFELQLGAGPTNPLQTVTAGTTFALGTGPAGPGSGLGYGYEFNRNILRWTTDAIPTDINYHDPRVPVLGGAFAEPDVTSNWKDDPASASNIAGISGAGDITDGAVIVLFDLPRQEITSLGQLRHMIGAKSYELGSSWGGVVNNNFDSAFVSTVPRNHPWKLDNSEPRPNRYLEIYTPAGVASATIADVRDPANSARYQLIKGAFNVNSTSVNAWRAVLGSRLAGWDHLGSAVGGISLDNAFFRTEHGAQQRAVLSGAIPPVPITTDLTTLSDAELLSATGRQLTNNEVDLLAAEIVRLLKLSLRPYTSLSAFINSGLIQTAIQNVSINSLTVGVRNANLRHTAAGLTQSDVIAAISPFMASRSDTFIVRAYGDVQNPVTGLVEGRAWCEATVQRVPDLVSDPAASLADVLNPPNPATINLFGRRFNIISFRWLTPDDL